MWQPDPGWHPVPGGTGTSTLGVWRTTLGQRPVVVKRLERPGADAPAVLSSPRHFAYWRRPADVATYGLVDSTRAEVPGMVGAPTQVEEDAEGITLTSDWTDDAANSGLFVARSLGRFAAADLGNLGWLARDQLRDRLARVADRGGWTTLARTAVRPVAERLWAMREEWLSAADALPQVAQHGDPTPANMPGRDPGDDTARLVAIDWSCLGHGPVGADLGLFSLSAREAFDPLLEAYLLGLPDELASPDQVLLGARVSAVYTAFTRAEWALARIDVGDGPLEAKYRHPAVAPHLRVLGRQTAAVEALLGE